MLDLIKQTNEIGRNQTSRANILDLLDFFLTLQAVVQFNGNILLSCKNKLLRFIHGILLGLFTNFKTLALVILDYSCRGEAIFFPFDMFVYATGAYFK